LRPTAAGLIGTRGMPYSAFGSFDHARMVHGSQSIELFEDIPPAGEVELTAEVAAIWDKGSAAVVELESVCRDPADGRTMLKTRHSLFCRGEGDFGGARGPTAAWEQPHRAPDAVVRYATRPEQALIYRLSGDRNPLHSDPAYARRGGFERPILHGLCTYGFTGRALVTAACEGDPSRLKAMSARFSRPVYPGDTLSAEIWSEGPQILFRTLNGAGETVIDQGVARVA
jgi:acyl dehydratase